MVTEHAKYYFALLDSELIECDSASDADAVNLADALLRHGDPCKPAELHRLAVVLVRYGRQRAAERLTNRANRIRAAQFLTENLNPAV